MTRLSKNISSEFTAEKRRLSENAFLKGEMEVSHAVTYDPMPVPYDHGQAQTNGHATALPGSASPSKDRKEESSCYVALDMDEAAKKESKSEVMDLAKQDHWHGMLDCSKLPHQPSNLTLYDQGRKEILLPTYLAVVMKAMRNLDEQNSSVDMSITLVMRIDFGELPKDVKDYLADNLKIRINEDELLLADLRGEPKWKKNIFFTTLRINLKDLVFSGEDEDYSVWEQFPFDAPEVNLRIEMTSVTVRGDNVHKDFKGYKVRYNLHEYFGRDVSETDVLEETLDDKLRRQRVMISFKKSADCLASFDIFHAGLRVRFPSETKKTETLVFKYSPVVCYMIPLFRHPGAHLRTMVFPLLVTNLSTIGTLLMGVGEHYAYGSLNRELAYNDRMNALVTILIALFAFLTFARSKLPDVPVTTIMDRFIFQSVAMTCMGIVQTVVTLKVQLLGGSQISIMFADVVFYVTWAIVAIQSVYLILVTTIKFRTYRRVLSTGQKVLKNSIEAKASKVDKEKEAADVARLRDSSVTSRLIGAMRQASQFKLNLGGAAEEIDDPEEKKRLAASSQVKKSSVDFNTADYGLPVSGTDM